MSISSLNKIVAHLAIVFFTLHIQFHRAFVVGNDPIKLALIGVGTISAIGASEQNVFP
jgi:hypothetical protein